MDTLSDRLFVRAKIMINGASTQSQLLGDTQDGGTLLSQCVNLLMLFGTKVLANRPCSLFNSSAARRRTRSLDRFASWSWQFDSLELLPMSIHDVFEGFSQVG